MLSEEQLIQNYEKYKSLLLQTGDHRSAQIEALIDHFGNRFVLCPASADTWKHNAFPGGLVDHSLRVLKNARRLAKVAPDLYADIPEESIVFAALLHDIGKLGSLDEDRYVSAQQYWEERGERWKSRKQAYVCYDFKGAPARDMSMFLLQHFKVVATYDEWEAILLNDGRYDKANEVHSSPGELAILIHLADMISTRQEKLITQITE